MIEEALFAYVQSVPALSGPITGVEDGVSVTRFGPIPLPQNSPLPAITFQRIDADEEVCHDGASNMTLARFQLDVWASSYTDARTVAVQARKAFQGWSGGTYAGVEVFESEVETVQDAVEPAAGLHRSIVDVMVFYREP